jgi:hypothetical protein
MGFAMLNPSYRIASFIRRLDRPMRPFVSTNRRGEDFEMLGGGGTWLRLMLEIMFDFLQGGAVIGLSPD